MLVLDKRDGRLVCTGFVSIFVFFFILVGSFSIFEQEAVLIIRFITGFRLQPLCRVNVIDRCQLPIRLLAVQLIYMLE